MSYKTKDLPALPPLAKPLAQLPPLPAMKKRRRYTVKTTEAPAAEIDQPENRIDEKTPPGYEPQPICEAPAADVDSQATPARTPHGYEPQLITPRGQKISEEANEAFEDMVELFLKHGNVPPSRGLLGCCPNVRTYSRISPMAPQAAGVRLG